MGNSLNLYSFDYDKLKDKIADFCMTENLQLIDKVLLHCGNKIGNRYIILNQDFCEGNSCFYNLSYAIDIVFGVEDTFSNIFCSFNANEVDRKELISSISRDELLHNLEE